MAALRPIKPSYWDQKLARHLLNRAGFGVPAARVAVLRDMGVDGAVDFLVNFDQLSPALSEPQFLVPPYSDDEAAEYRELPDVERTLARQERQRRERVAIENLKAWWLERMWRTPRPLEEKLALFWHGHFATSAQKVKSSHQNYELNKIFRNHAAGSVKALTVAAGQSPAMLDYLDNRKSTKKHPNENWARELMELFTLGQGQYTEDDIKESARAFTGWSSTQREFEYQIEQHDFGTKTFMGKTGEFDGWDIINIIFEQETVATFICDKLWKFFVSEEMDERAVDKMAQTLRENNYELKPVLHELFRSVEFYDRDVQAQQIKSPVQFSLQLCDDLAIANPPFADMAKACRAMGQDLFYPPNVKGWDGNRAWINANSLLIRYNLPPLAVRAAMKTAQQKAAGATEPTMMMNGGSTNGQMKEVAMEGRQRVESEVREYLSMLPKPERRETALRLREATPDERKEILAEMGIEPPDWEMVDPAYLLNELKFATAGELVEALSARFLAVPIAPPQRTVFLNALSLRESDPLAPDDLSIEQRRALVRLVTSMAEYQLC